MKVKIKSESDLSRTIILGKLKLTVGKWYEAELTHLKCHNIRYYMITCDDEYSRRFPLSYFITLEEWRDSELGELLI